MRSPRRWKIKIHCLPVPYFYRRSCNSRKASFSDFPGTQTAVLQIKCDDKGEPNRAANTVGGGSSISLCGSCRSFSRRGTIPPALLCSHPPPCPSNHRLSALAILLPREYKNAYTGATWKQGQISYVSHV